MKPQAWRPSDPWTPPEIAFALGYLLAGAGGVLAVLFAFALLLAVASS